MYPSIRSGFLEDRKDSKGGSEMTNCCEMGSQQASKE